MEQPKQPCRILIKRRLTGPPGPPEKLEVGELAFNYTNETLNIGMSSTPQDMGEF